LLQLYVPQQSTDLSSAVRGWNDHDQFHGKLIFSSVPGTSPLERSSPRHEAAIWRRQISFVSHRVCKEASGGVGVGRMIAAGLKVMQWKA
jgi:hypothetical protein